MCADCFGQGNADSYGVAGAIGCVRSGLGIGLPGNLGRVRFIHNDALLGGVAILMGRHDLAGRV